MQIIYKYIKHISSLFLCLAVFSVQAQEKKDAKMPEIKWWNGFTIQTDVVSLVSSAMNKGETYSMESGLQVDLKHKYYPIVEIGFAGANKLTTNNAGFKTNGLFGRIGVDFNLIKQKKDIIPTNNLFLLGLRFGMSSFKYDITNVTITDDYWHGSETLSYNNQIATKTWYELVAGVQVEVLKNIFMGWTMRKRNIIGKDPIGEVFPWYIPGFGINTSSNWGFNYTLGYKF